ncbi:hypothetical protein PARU111607_08340 [Palleronia rufa]
MKAVVQWRARAAPDRDPSRVPGSTEDRGSVGPVFILNRRALAPVQNRPGIDARFPTQLGERRLRPLYRYSEGVRGRSLS